MRTRPCRSRSVTTFFNIPGSFQGCLALARTSGAATGLAIDSKDSPQAKLLFRFRNQARRGVHHSGSRVVELAGKESALRLKHRIHLDVVTVVTAPEDYTSRLVPLYAGAWDRLRLFALEAHDLALTKWNGTLNAIARTWNTSLDLDISTHPPFANGTCPSCGLTSSVHNPGTIRRLIFGSSHTFPLLTRTETCSPV